MIDEKFLIASVNIRKRYIELVSNLEIYQQRAQRVAENLKSIYDKLDKMQKDYEKDKKKNPLSTEEVLKVLSEGEEEGSKLEKLMEPLNKKIESLNLEEAELWRQIKMKHSELDDDLIIEQVHYRLIQENLQ